MLNFDKIAEDLKTDMNVIHAAYSLTGENETELRRMIAEPGELREDIIEMAFAMTCHSIKTLTWFSKEYRR